MKKVTKQERWDFVKNKDVTYTPYGDYPYTGLWKNRSGDIIAKDVPVGKHIGVSSLDKYEYYVQNNKKDDNT